MKLDKTDSLVLLTSSVLVVLLSGVLYLHLTKKVERKADSGAIGTLSFKRFRVLRKYEERVVWEDIEKNEDIYPNDSILTKESSDAKLSLKNGVEFELSPNSMVIIDNYQDNAALKVKSGRVKSAGKKGEKAYLITDSGEAFDVGEADVSMAVTEDGKTELSVKKGTVKYVDEKGKKGKIKKGEKLTSDKDRKKQIVKIEIDLKKPYDEEIFLTSNSTYRVEFKWKTPEGFSGGTVSVAGNPSFQDERTFAAGENNSIEISLEPGTWYWKVTGENGKKKFVSQINRTDIIRIQVPQPLVPSAGNVMEFQGKNPKIQFAWNISRKCEKSVLVISDSRDFRGKFKEKYEIQAQAKTVEMPGSGEYFWSVRCQFEGRVTQDIDYPVQSFKLQKRKNAPAPKVVTKKGESFNEIEINRGGAFLRWKPVAQANYYRVTISTDVNMKNTVFSQISDGVEFPVPKELKAGKYYWTVKASFGKYSESDDSKPRLIEIKEITGIEIKRPPKDSIYDEEQNGSNIRFAWYSLGDDFYYHFILSRSRKLKDPIIDVRTDDSNYLVHRNLEYGTYYWQVRAYYKSNSKSKVQSGINTVYYVRKILPSATNLQPNAQELVVNQDPLVLTWNEVPSADRYLVSVYLIQNGTQKRIFSDYSKRTSFTLPESEKLEPGDYVWYVVPEKRKDKMTVQMGPKAMAEFSLRRTP